MFSIGQNATRILLSLLSISSLLLVTFSTWMNQGRIQELRMEGVPVNT